MRSNLPRSVRAIRRRLGWRQADLGARARVSREMISRIERGEVAGTTLDTIDRVVTALDGVLDVSVRWHGEKLDRAIDAMHARLVESAAATLRRLGWIVRIEVSFNHFGDRGRMDMLAFHSTGMLLVVEVKSAIGDIQDTLGRLDVKVRLGKEVAATLGWDDVRAVIPVLVLGETRTARRIVGGHYEQFRRFGVRGRQAVAWVRKPNQPAPSGLLWFANVTDSYVATLTRGSRVRVVR